MSHLIVDDRDGSVIAEFDRVVAAVRVAERADGRSTAQPSDDVLSASPRVRRRTALTLDRCQPGVREGVSRFRRRRS
jgi:hypothetical protein